MATASQPSTLQTPPTASQEPDQGADAAIIATLAGVLASGLGASATLGLVSSVLTAAGIASVVGGTNVASEALRLASLAQVPESRGRAASVATRQGWTYRATYLLNAARRLAKGALAGDFAKALSQERLYAAAHVEAQARRMAAARAVDAIAARSGPWLMWHARKDARTTPECRAADGKVWHVDQSPSIGLPGSTHVQCRCWTGPGRPGLQTVDEAVRGVT